MGVRGRVTDRRGGLPAIGVALIAVAVAVATAFAASGGISPTPFGIPNAANPNPAANITAVRGDRSWYWTEQTRSEVLARHGVVATSQPLAAQAGLQMLKDGGNAADAAVATAAMLGLVEPESAGIGGDMEAIYYSAKDHRLYGLNAAGWAPASATPAFYHQQGLNSVPVYGVFSVTVPGAVDGWSRFLNRFGTHVAGACAPAVDRRPRRQGFGLTERIRGDWESYDGFYVDMLKQDPESSKVFLRNGHVPAALQHLPQPGPGAGVSIAGQGRPEGVLRRPDRTRDRAPHERGRRRLEDVGPQLVQVAMGRPDHDQLQGLRRLPDAAADPGVRDVGDVEHPPGVRVTRGLRPARRSVLARRRSGASWSRRSGWPTRTC